MTYRIRVAETAKRGLRRLSTEAQGRVRIAIGSLAEEPRPSASKKLKGATGIYSLRVGAYRVLYGIDDSNRCISIYAIKHRREAYKRL
jgi:mRNA interferase RelE/StbE